MRVEFSPEARAEFEDAELYYEQQLSGLGGRFRNEVREAITRILNWPLAAPIERGDIHRLLLSRFPYKLLYAIESRLHLYRHGRASASCAKLLDWSPPALTAPRVLSARADRINNGRQMKAARSTKLPFRTLGDVEHARKSPASPRSPRSAGAHLPRLP